MSATTDKTDGTPQAATAQPPKPEAADGKGQPAGQRQQVQVDDTKAVSSYANFCRVTGTPEELIVDFGLNSQPTGIPTQPIVINQRVILNYYTAKRLLAALHMSLERHEGAFGVLETDIQKRVQPAVHRQPASAAN